MRHVTTRAAGLIILVAGIWGGLIPFVGPYFHFTLGPDHAWAWTSARFYLNVLPSIAAVVGGLLLLSSGPRLAGKIGALFALAGGVWFAVGPDVSRLWHAGGAQGIAHGGTTRQMLEYLTLHAGLGVLIAVCAAYALPGVLAVRRRATAAEAAAAGTGAAATAPVAARAGTAPARTAPAGTTPARRGLFGLFGRRRRAAAGEEPVAGRDREGVAGADTAPAGAAAPAADRESVGAPERR